MVAWWGTSVEVLSALARLSREGDISAPEYKHGIARLQVLRESWDEIAPTDRVRSLAEGLPFRYAIRAADSFQLAAALVWTSERPRNRAFVCIDHRLAEAADAAGFRVLTTLP